MYEPLFWMRKTKSTISSHCRQKGSKEDSSDRKKQSRKEKKKLKRSSPYFSPLPLKDGRHYYHEASAPILPPAGEALGPDARHAHLSGRLRPRHAPGYPLPFAARAPAGLPRLPEPPLRRPLLVTSVDPHRYLRILRVRRRRRRRCPGRVHLVEAAPLRAVHLGTLVESLYAYPHTTTPLLFFHIPHHRSVAPPPPLPPPFRLRLFILRFTQKTSHY